MATATGRGAANHQADAETAPRGSELLRRTRSAELVQQGIDHIGQAARLAIASVEDMLNGLVTVQEATVINAAVRSNLKAAELQAKHGRLAQDYVQPLAIPGKE